MPAVPALSPGCRWDLVGRIVARGRRDLFNGPVWQAIHNYSRNRPLDYPYDIGNQEGAAFTERFYRTIAAEPWGEDGWRGRTLAEVNRLRIDRSNPGATVMDDAVGWLAYEYFDARNRRHLGHSIPILSTENGYLVGEDIDPRYPATTPDLHMAQTLEACRIMMGASQRFDRRPTTISAPVSGCWQTVCWTAPATGGRAMPGTANAGQAEHCPLCALSKRNPRWSAGGRPAEGSAHASCCAAPWPTLDRGGC